MPLLGWGLGVAFAGLIEAVDHWVALRAARRDRRQDDPRGVGDDDDAPGEVRLSGTALLLAAIATSIDAAAAGVDAADARRAGGAGGGDDRGGDGAAVPRRRAAGARIGAALRARRRGSAAGGADRRSAAGSSPSIPAGCSALHLPLMSGQEERPPSATSGCSAPLRSADDRPPRAGRCRGRSAAPGRPTPRTSP